jgi:hypothetical protein
MINATALIALGASGLSNSSSVSFAYTDVVDTFSFNVRGTQPAVPNYPNACANAAGAIPVYVVATPAVNYDPPNYQGNILGAIPVNVTTISANPNAIPINIVATPTPSGGNDQGVITNAIPVYYSSANNAMPVWNAS